MDGGDLLASQKLAVEHFREFSSFYCNLIFLLAKIDADIIGF